MKDNKGTDKKRIALILEAIIIVFILVLTLLILTKSFKGSLNSSKKEKEVVLTKEQKKIDKIIENFNQSIEEVKSGVEVSYITCNESINCKNINTFNVREVTITDAKKDGTEIYKIVYEWNCLDENTCFENTPDSKENNMFVSSRYYEVDSKGNITKNIGQEYKES